MFDYNSRPVSLKRFKSFLEPNSRNRLNNPLDFYFKFSLTLSFSNILSVYFKSYLFLCLEKSFSFKAANLF